MDIFWNHTMRLFRKLWAICAWRMAFPIPGILKTKNSPAGGKAVESFISPLHGIFYKTGSHIPGGGTWCVWICLPYDKITITKINYANWHREFYDIMLDVHCT